MAENSPNSTPGRETVLDRFLSRFSEQNQSVFYIIVAGVLFVLTSALIKVSGSRIPVIQIVAVRQVVMALAVAPLLLQNFPANLRTNHLSLHAMRIGGALIAITCGFTSLVHLPLADATAIAFAKSFFVTIFAIFILSEVVGVRRWSATIVGFIGVLIMLRPGVDALNVYGLYAVVASMAAGFVMVIVRILTRYDSPLTILSYQAIFVGLLTIPFAAYYWVQPTLAEWGILVLIALISVFAQLANINAFKRGEATMLASLDYLRLIWATLIGVMLFAEWPSLTTLLGAGVVILAALYVIRREAQLDKKIARDPLGRGLSQ